MNHNIPVPSRSGTDVARFLFVAGRRDDFAAIRKFVDHYGNEGGRDWRPFLPTETKAIGIISQNVAYNADLHFEVLSLHGGVLEEIRQAEAANNIVVLVIDPWSASLDHFNAFLQNYDQSNFTTHSCIIIIWNPDDTETKDHCERLAATIDTLLYRTLTGNSNYHDKIASLHTLQGELMAAICEARNRIQRKAALLRRFTSHSMPKLSGPR